MAGVQRASSALRALDEREECEEFEECEECEEGEDDKARLSAPRRDMVAYLLSPPSKFDGSKIK